MRKVIFVAGGPGVGKSSFIQSNFQDEERYYRFDAVTESLRLFGDIKALEDDDNDDFPTVVNSMIGKGIDAFLEGKDLVVEICTEGDEELLLETLINLRKSNLNSEFILLTVEADEASKRIKMAGNDYYPSIELKELTLELLNDVFEAYRSANNIELICEVGNVGGNVRFYKDNIQGKPIYFFTSAGSGFLDLKVELKDLVEQTDTIIKTYPDFAMGMKALMNRYTLFKLPPLQLHRDYKKEFLEAWEIFKEEIPGGEPDRGWQGLFLEYET